MQVNAYHDGQIIIFHFMHADQQLGEHLGSERQCVCTCMDGNLVITITNQAAIIHHGPETRTCIAIKQS